MGKSIGTVFSCLMALVGVAVVVFGIVRGEVMFVVCGLVLALLFSGMVYLGLK